MSDIWNEIKAAADEQRRELILRSKENEKELPSELYQLKLLNFLDISSLPIATIDNRISNLQKLTQLYLKDTEIAELPDSICDLKLIKCLDISQNHLKQLPKRFGNLSNLQSLNVSSNNLSIFPESISNCSSLSVINFSSNKFVGFPVMLTDAPLCCKLSQICASQNQLVKIEDSIENLTALKSLDLSKNCLKQLPQSLSKCHKLKQINFKSNQLEDNRLKKLIEQENGTKSILNYIRSRGSTSNFDKCGKKKKLSKAKESRKNVELSTDAKFYIKVLKSENGITEGCKPLKIFVSDDVSQVRPYIVACILRGLNLKEPSKFRRFISIQTQIHSNICHKRSLASIGTHDLIKLKNSQLIYDAKNPTLSKIKPLGSEEEISVEEYFKNLQKKLKNCSKHPTGVEKYLHLINNFDKSACLCRIDDGCVLSLPPLINCEDSKLTSQTSDVLVEVTASTSLNKCKEVMNAFLEELIEKEFFSNVDSNHVVACDDEKTLVVQQVRCEDSNERLKVVYPSKTDLVSLAPLIKVIR